MKPKGKTNAEAMFCIALLLSSAVLLYLTPYLSLTQASAQQLDSFEKKEKREGKIDSQIIHKRDQVQANKSELKGSIIAEEIRVVLTLDGNDSPSTSQIKELKKLGVKIETSHKNLLQAIISEDQLDAISKLDFIRYISEPTYAIPNSVSEGPAVIGANELNAAGYNGQNVKVAVIDSGFDLSNPKIMPNVVESRSFRADGDIQTTDPTHGTAVSEIILDTAPAAQLFLYNVDTQVSFLNALDYITKKHQVDIVSVSMAFFAGQYDGTSEISQAVDELRESGILFITSAGNYAQSHWEGNFIDANSNGFRDFSSGDETLGIYANKGQFVRIFLSWDDWPVSFQDYDLYVLDETLDVVTDSINPQVNGFPPKETLAFVAPYSGVYNIVIYKYDSTHNVKFDLFSPDAGLLEYIVNSGSVTTPADAAGAFTVGAFFWQNGELEPFSSRGPTNDGRIKPDISGPDGVTTSTLKPFYGTSAAAPYVAGAAALVKNIYPKADADTMQSLLEQNTADKHAKSNTDGTGKVNLNFLLSGIPITHAGADQIVNEGSSVVLDGSSSIDSDGAIISYIWEQVGAESSVSLTNSNSAVASFIAPEVISDTDLTFKLSTIDNLGASSSDTMKVTIKNVNRGPAADAGPDIIVSEAGLVTLNATATDPDNGNLVLSWTQIAGPLVILDNATAEDPTFQAPLVSADSILEFQFMVIDDAGLNANDTVRVSVLDYNLPPLAQNQSLTTNEDTPLDITLVGSDPEGEALSFIITSEPAFGRISILQSNQTSMKLTYTPNADVFGDDTISFRISDGSLEDDGVINLAILNVNDPPIANAGLDQNIYEGQEATLDGSGSYDPDDTELRYLWEQIEGVPQIVLNNATSAIASFTTPAVATNSTVTFTLSVSDVKSNETSVDTVNLMIVNAQSAINGTAFIDLNKNGNVDPSEQPQQGITINLSGATSKTAITDARGYYSFEGLMPGTYLISETIPAGFHKTYPVNDTNLVTVKASNQYFTNRNFLNAPNATPSVDAGINQTSNEGTLVRLDGTGIDDFAGLTFVWSQISGPTITFDNPALEDATFIAPAVTSTTLILLNLTATDSDGISASDIVSILVVNVNQSPVASAGEDQVVKEKARVTLDGAASRDQDGSLVSVVWEQVSGPAVSLESTSTISTSFIAPKIERDTALTFRLIIRDNDNSTATDDVTIRIKNSKESSSGGGGGGGGGGGFGGYSGGNTLSTPEENITTFPSSFFLSNPLSKIIVQSTSFSNLEGVTILQAAQGQQIQIGSKLMNRQEVPQTYYYIMEILDENGVVIEVKVQHGTIDASKTSSIAYSWQPTEVGDFTLKIFIWDNIGNTPEALAGITERSIRIV